MQRLLDNRTGKKILPETYVSYKVEGDFLLVDFSAYDSSLNSFSHVNNDQLYRGDVVEVFLDLGDEFYYELEVAPNGATFVAKIIDKTPIFINDDFFKSEVKVVGNDYFVKMSINLAKLGRFETLKMNAFRIETRGIRTDYILQALSPTMTNTFHVRDKFFEIESWN